jgi:hypothetical protein
VAEFLNDYHGPLPFQAKVCGGEFEKHSIGDSACIATLSTLYITMVGAGFRAFDCVYQDGEMRLEGDMAVGCGFESQAQLFSTILRILAIYCVVLTISAFFVGRRAAVIPTTILIVLMMVILLMADLMRQPDHDGQILSVPWWHISLVGGAIAVIYGVTLPAYVAKNLQMSGPPPFSIEVAAQYGWFLNRFRDECWYAEFVQMGRKLAFMAIVTFLNKEALVAWAAFGVLTLLSYEVQRRLQPFIALAGEPPAGKLGKWWSLNGLELLSIMVQGLNLLVAAYFLGCDHLGVRDTDSTLAIGLASLVLLTNFGIGVLGTFMWWGSAQAIGRAPEITAGGLLREISHRLRMQRAGVRQDTLEGAAGAHNMELPVGAEEGDPVDNPRGRDRWAMASVHPLHDAHFEVAPLGSPRRPEVRSGELVEDDPDNDDLSSGGSADELDAAKGPADGQDGNALPSWPGSSAVPGRVYAAQDPAVSQMGMAVAAARLSRHGTVLSSTMEPTQLIIPPRGHRREISVSFKEPGR